MGNIFESLHRKRSPVSPAGSVSASALKCRGVHWTPAPFNKGGRKLKIKAPLSKGSCHEVTEEFYRTINNRPYGKRLCRVKRLMRRKKRIGLIEYISHGSSRTPTPTSPLQYGNRRGLFSPAGSIDASAIKCRSIFFCFSLNNY